MLKNIIKTFAQFSIITISSGALSLLAVFSLAGYFSRENELCELVSHLRLANCTAALSILIILICCKARWTIFFALTVLAVNLPPVLSLFAPQQNADAKVSLDEQRRTADPNTNFLKLLEMNLWGGKNFNHEVVLKLVNDNDADLVGFSEVTGTWAQVLKAKLKSYPYRIVQPAYGGIALFSKFPFVSTELRYSGIAHRPRIFARIKIKNQIVTIIFAHPLIPIHTFAGRNTELEEIAKEASLSTDPVVVAGDLNCTPWSYYFDKLKNDGKLIDTEQGFGPQSSWNVVTPLLPIDHCLTSADILTISRIIGPAFGSDHLPVEVELKLPKHEKTKKSVM